MIKLNLGSGYRPSEGFVNIDVNPDCEPDIVCDITYGLPYKDNEVDAIKAVDFLEHIPIGKTIFVIEEIWRVLKPGGIFEHVTPSTDGRGAFQDPTHLSFWNILQEMNRTIHIFWACLLLHRILHPSSED